VHDVTAVSKKLHVTGVALKMIGAANAMAVIANRMSLFIGVLP
jgi:hypothetical protein